MKNRKISKWFILLLALSVVVNVSFAGAETSVALQRAPFNSDFLESLTKLQMLAEDTRNQNATGYWPSPISLKHLTENSLFKGNILALATSYDLRSLGRVTAVKDQGSAGSCWTFGTYGSLESNILTSESVSWDFSENNLKNTHGFDLAHDEGGNAFMSAAYLARWSGPVTESSDPYNDSSGVSPGGQTPVKHVQNVVFLPDRTSSTDNTAIKQAIVSYGAVYVAMYYGSSYYNATNHAYYYSGSSSANHAITVVGWDDNYSKSNFSSTPSGNGAFIVKNSWGSSWGESGYFYVSYYDKIFGYSENALFVTPEATTNYAKAYQYDPLGWVSSLGYSSTTGWFANIFSATGAQSLKAVSFYTASTSNTYQIKIYTGASSGPVSGTLAYTQTGTISNAGYVTVPLTSSVSLTSGQKFSVVVKLTTSNYNYPIPVEVPVSGYSSAATASSGQSYISSNGTSWSDLTKSYSKGNVCLKAFTN